MSNRNRSSNRATRLRIQLVAGIWRIVWILLAIATLALIYPLRLVENEDEVATVQAQVDAMSGAHDSIVAGDSGIDDFETTNDGFAGFEAVTPAGVPAVGLVGRAGDDCIVMHWTSPGIAQVGRLESERSCDPTEIEEVPVRPNLGYVPGTGPPFDVTPLIYESRTAIWFFVALVFLTWVLIRSALDLVLIFVRPDHFFEG